MAVDVDFAGADASLQTDILPTQDWQPWQVTQGHLANARFKRPAVTMRPVTVEQRLELDMDKSASRGDDQGRHEQWSEEFGHAAACAAWDSRKHLDKSREIRIVKKKHNY